MGKVFKQLGKGVVGAITGPQRLVRKALQAVGAPKTLTSILTPSATLSDKIGIRDHDIPGIGQFFLPKPEPPPNPADVPVPIPPQENAPSSPSDGSFGRALSPLQAPKVAQDDEATPTQRGRAKGGRIRGRKRGFETLLTGSLGAPQSGANVQKSTLGG